MGLGEVATRDWIRSELQDLMRDLAEQRVLPPADPSRGRDEPDRPEH